MISSVHARAVITFAFAVIASPTIFSQDISSPEEVGRWRFDLEAFQKTGNPGTDRIQLGVIEYRSSRLTYAYDLEQDGQTRSNVIRLLPFDVNDRDHRCKDCFHCPDYFGGSDEIDRAIREKMYPGEKDTSDKPIFAFVTRHPELGSRPRRDTKLTDIIDGSFELDGVTQHSFYFGRGDMAHFPSGNCNDSWPDPIHFGYIPSTVYAFRFESHEETERLAREAFDYFHFRYFYDSGRSYFALRVFWEIFYDDFFKGTNESFAKRFPTFLTPNEALARMLIEQDMDYWNAPVGKLGSYFFYWAQFEEGLSLRTVLTRSLDFASPYSKDLPHLAEYARPSDYLRANPLFPIATFSPRISDIERTQLKAGERPEGRKRFLGSEMKLEVVGTAIHKSLLKPRD